MLEKSSVAMTGMREDIKLHSERVTSCEQAVTDFQQLTKEMKQQAEDLQQQLDQSHADKADITARYYTNVADMRIAVINHRSLTSCAVITRSSTPQLLNHMDQSTLPA